MTALFETQEQTVPQTQPPLQKLPSYRKLSLLHENSTVSSAATDDDKDGDAEGTNKNEALTTDVGGSAGAIGSDNQRLNLIEGLASRDTIARLCESKPVFAAAQAGNSALSEDKRKLLGQPSSEANCEAQQDDYYLAPDKAVSDTPMDPNRIPISDFNERMAEQQISPSHADDGSHASYGDTLGRAPLTVTGSTARQSPGLVQNAFNRMRPRRSVVDVAEITIGDKTSTVPLASSTRRKPEVVKSLSPPQVSRTSAALRFSSSMQEYAAPGTQLQSANGVPNEDISEEESDDRDVQLQVTALSEDEDLEPVSRQGGGPDMLEAREDGESSSVESVADHAQSDEDFLDEDDEKAKENARVTALIVQAEEAAALPTFDNTKRAYNILKGGGQKDPTLHLVQIIEESIDRIVSQLQGLGASLEGSSGTTPQPHPTTETEASSPEERLSLTVLKEDFAHMDIVGQFNLGFVLAVRPSRSSTTSDELFIIDQHASDEKFNFERLQSTTIVQNQRLVHPYRLDLTAIEEEIILENKSALMKNGFLIDVDTSGDRPVGQRCQLVSLPMSREVTFDISDLEELIALLAETNPSGRALIENNPRPSKVRKMFAMRACRSSVMIGKSLSMKQMRKLVNKMGEIDKPWNCPHGRPTMRHVLGLGNWQAWKEGDGEDIGSAAPDSNARRIGWDGWMRKMRGTDENGTWEGIGLELDQDIDGGDGEDEEASEGVEGSGESEEGEEEDEKDIDEEEEEEGEEDEEGEGEDRDSEDEIGNAAREGLFNRFAHAE